MPQVNVVINGRTYRMACDTGEEPRLLALAAELNRHVDTLKGSFGEIGDMRLTVMAGIMVADELMETRKQIDALQADLAHLKERHAEMLALEETHQHDIAMVVMDVCERVEKITSLMTDKNKETSIA